MKRWQYFSDEELNSLKTALECAEDNDVLDALSEKILAQIIEYQQWIP